MAIKLASAAPSSSNLRPGTASEPHPCNLHQLIRRLNSKRCFVESAGDRASLGDSQQPGFSTVRTGKDSLGDYALGKTIGTGVFAKVRRAVHKPTKEVVAVKIFEKDRRLSGEAQILQSLSHPNIVQYRSAFDSSKYKHVVLEYIPGTTLKKFIKANRCVQETEMQAVFKQLVDAVTYLHCRGLAHRDIKLENILVTPTGQVKLIDFGFAAYDIATARVHCGTPKYMAPELLDKKQDALAPADVWALGNVLFCMLTQKLPFYGHNKEELDRKIRGSQYWTPTFASVEVQDLLKRMLDVDPQTRISASAVRTHPWLTATLH